MYIANNLYQQAVHVVSYIYKILEMVNKEALKLPYRAN